MAPPGILSTDEHLDAVRSTYKNISAPAFSPVSKWSACTATQVNKSIFHDHDYVTQHHQQPFCESSTNSKSYEEIDIVSIDFDDFVSKTVPEVGDATGVDDSNYGNKKTLASTHGVDNSKCLLIGVNDTRDSNNKPISWFMDDDDGDFLDELDNLDLELDDFDPCIDMDTEDSFQHLIEETLNSPTTNTCLEDEFGSRGIRDEEENTHKKEFFLKFLGLQSVPHTMQNQESFLEDCATNTTCLHTFAQGTSPVGVEIREDSLCQRSSHPLACSSAITPHTSSLAASVPAKMCSCAVSDWKNSLLYSTAPACSNGLVQTNLSTAPTKSVAYNMAAQNLRFTSNSNDGNVMHSSPSLEPLNNFEGLTTCSLLRDGLPHKNQSDADAFLQWLEEEGETVSSPQAATEMSERSGCINFKNDIMSAQPKVGGTNCVSETKNVSTSHSIPDLDSFIDLETYAMEKSPSSIQLEKDTHSYLSNHNRDSKVHPEKLELIESKYPPSSELRFRLSLLDDLGCRKDRYLETRDASCPFGISSDDVNGSCKSYPFDDALADLTSDAASSPLSPYSSSSVNSSYGQPKGGEDSLDLLGLFSEENSFLLMEQSDSRYGFC